MSSLWKSCALTSRRQASLRRRTQQKKNAIRSFSPLLSSLYPCDIPRDEYQHQYQCQHQCRSFSLQQHGQIRSKYAPMRQLPISLDSSNIHTTLSAATAAAAAANTNNSVTHLQGTTTRSLTSVSELVPEFAQHWTVWGASGHLLKTIHWGGVVPYWACMSITNVIVRTSLVPLVLESAHTSVRFSKVAPEVQFLITIFQHDLKRQRAEGASITEQRTLIFKSLQTLRGIYKLHDIHPLAIFKAPLMQLPIFWYFSIDIRKIINGADPELAQQLTESGFLWIADLTEPDPWYGLPVIAGALLYLNVELAIGRKSLSGETASKSNMALLFKDFFQCLAVFMPCFMSHSPAGVQIYLTTSFIFTLFQGAALRNDSFRETVGLPTAVSPKVEPILANEFIELKKMEQKAKEARGEDGELLGVGVLAPGWEVSFEGKKRPSTIQVSSNSSTVWSNQHDFLSGMSSVNPSVQVGIVDNPKVYALPPKEALTVDNTRNTNKEVVASSTSSITDANHPPPKSELTFRDQSPEEAMEAANRGELPPPAIVLTDPTQPNKSNTFDAKKFAAKRKKARKRTKNQPRKK